MWRARHFLVAVVVVISTALGRPAQAQQTSFDREHFARDLAALTMHPSRVIGTRGYDEAASYIERELTALGPAIEWRRHEYPVMAPATTSAMLHLRTPGVLAPSVSPDQPVYPFWPAGVRLCSTPAEGITGRAVYCGNASYREIKPKDLAGQIAVVEASAREFWTHAPYFGARAVLVLGSPETTHLDLRAHDLIIPVDLPRFYVPPGPLADALRGGRVSGDVTLTAKVNWRRVTARNYYALVKGKAAAANGAAALAISVPFESSGLVSDLAPGAGQAVQAACGLAALRDAAARPLDRPVMVCFGGADSVQFLATRNMFLALSDVPVVWEKERIAIEAEGKQAEDDLADLRAVAAGTHVLDVTHDRGAIDRVVKIIEGDLSLEQDDLFRLRRKPAASLTADDRASIDRLQQRQLALNQLRYAFQRRPAQVATDFPDLGKTYIGRTVERLSSDVDGVVHRLAQRHTELTSRAELYRWIAGALGRNPNPGDRANNSRLIELLVALDLSDGGTRVGPLYWGWFQQTPNINQIQDYRDWFAQQTRSLSANTPESAWLRPLMGVLDFEPLSGSRAPQSWLATSMPIGSEMCRAWGVPGFSMITLDDPRLRRDTPTDTPDRLNTANILTQLDATWLLLRNAWNDPRFKGQPEYRWMRTTVQGQVVGTAVGRPVADLPREGFVATYYYAKQEARKIPDLRGTREVPYTLGIRRSEVRDCDAEGRYAFEGLPVLAATSETELMLLAPHAYRITPDTGEINACTDLGRQSADLKLFADLVKPLDPFRSVVFACEPFTLVGLYDPRFLQTLNEVVPLDAGRNAEPQRYNAVIRDQLMAGFVEPGTRNHLIFRFGNVGNRILLINAADGGAGESASAGGDSPRNLDRREGHGFTAAQLNRLSPLALVTARDFWRLDDRRIRDYARAGVTSSLIDAMHREAGEQIARAEAALAANDAQRLMEQANGAWANNARVYAAVDDMARDVVRAAIVLLLLCVPFSFCMERLLIGTPNIYKQIAGGCAIFALMAAALWSFHPAFKISSSPLIIILSFAIIFMSIVVIVVVYGKFDTELKRVRSGRGSSDGASFARATVLFSAVVLGIANMRKRRFRTMLTALTIVLITFAVLCFTSSTRFVGTTALATGTPTSHPGLMLRQRGFRPMSPVISENLRPLLPSSRVVERWWNVNPAEPKEHLHVVARATDGGTPRVFAAQAVLGLSPGEAALSRVDDVIGPDRFAALERGAVDVIYLPTEAAQQLGVRESETVHLAGHALKVAGVYDAAAFDERAMALSGEPLAPLRYTVNAIDAGGRKLKNTDADSLDLDGGGGNSSEAGAYEHLSGSQIVIVPASVSRVLSNGSLRSVEVGLEDQAQVEAAGAELAKRFSLAMFAGYDDGVRLVTAGNLSSVSGAGQVAIPLALAGLIIFNTMMGSIAERKREIHVYTSLGLAPMHVGALFVAEALTYGLIGTVFGYVIGQGVGTALLKLGWLGDVTLNYSGTSAILTMGLILLIVLISALVPARLASRIAAPSIDRTWQVPRPQGDEIRAALPFTINKTAADGALAYLAQFFQEHREGSIGKFSAGDVEVVPPAGDGSDSSRAIQTLIWLTPFDLGVRQRLKLCIRPPSAGSAQADHPDIFEVEVLLHRLSGDDASWYRMNRTFLTELRKQFLQWRSLTPQRMREYVEESRALFAPRAAPMSPAPSTATADPL